MISILLDILFPKYCLECGKEGRYICKDCEIYMVDASPASGTTALWEYNGVVREAIQRIRGGEWAIIEEMLEIGLKNFSIDCDILTYVPKEEFNPSKAIAKELGKRLEKPVVEWNKIGTNKKIILIDDFYEPGGKIDEYEHALEKNNKVWKFVLARII